MKRSRLRVRLGDRVRLLVETPSWEEIEGSLVSICTNNLWRVRPLYCLDDLVQEAALRYVYCCEMYWALSEPDFKKILLRSVTNRMHDLATKRTRTSDLSSIPDGFDAIDIAAKPDLGFDELLAKAPPEVMEFYEVVCSAPLSEFKRHSRKGSRRETSVRRISRIMGLPLEEAKALRRKLKTFAENLASLEVEPV